MKIIGNPVRIRNCTRSCKFQLRYAICTVNTLSHCPEHSGWEGINKRNKSEDLPSFETILLIKLREKKLERYRLYFSLNLPWLLKIIYMRRIAVLLTTFMLFCAFAEADKLYLLSDTIKLHEVVTYGTLKKYQSGAKIEEIPSKQFEQGQDGNLEQLLSRTTPIPFKSTAGGLATIRIRGTAPDHTSINFGGININSLTLGHSNVSNVPMYLFDGVGIQFGSSSAVNGSGSIGGAIHLSINNQWTKGFKGEARIAHGSFGEQLYGTKLYFGNGKFEAVTRAYYYDKDNDFKFFNTTEYDFPTQTQGVDDVQRNADVTNMGLIQELNYKFSEDEILLFKAWVENDWHLVQQNMQTNYNNPDKREEYVDEHIRIWADYNKKINSFQYNLSAGYVYDNSVHNKNVDDTIMTQRLIGEAYLEQKLPFNANYKVGAKATRIYPTVYTYSGNIEYEDRIDLYLSYFHQIANKVKITANLRQGFVSDYNVPFTPALGINYIALSEEKTVLNLSANVSRSYRVPTLNDRFWGDQGNPDLLPEDGINYELGSKLSYCDANTSGNLKANIFYMNIDQMILWKNGDIGWVPYNVEKVKSKGLEIMADLTYKMWILTNVSGINYSFTSSEPTKINDNTYTVGQQLEYVPKHSANFYTTSSYKNMDFSIDGAFSGERYTDRTNENILPAYFLLNIASSYNYKINEDHSIRISGMINNLLNTDYQMSLGYAMPGINYRVSLTYNFK